MLKAKEILSKNPEVRWYLKKIIEQLKPEKVILFGSKATGTSTRASDTDFAVVGAANFDKSEIFGALDIIDFEKASKDLQDIILKEGIVLYDKKRTVV